MIYMCVEQSKKDNLITRIYLKK